VLAEQREQPERDGGARGRGGGSEEGVEKQSAGAGARRRVVPGLPGLSAGSATGARKQTLENRVQLLVSVRYQTANGIFLLHEPAPGLYLCTA